MAYWFTYFRSNFADQNLVETSSTFLLLHNFYFRCSVIIFRLILYLIKLIIEILLITSKHLKKWTTKYKKFHHNNLHRRIINRSPIDSLHINIEYCHNNQRTSWNQVGKWEEIHRFKYQCCVKSAEEQLQS